MQKFKNDATENNFYAAGSLAIGSQIDLKNQFFADAFTVFPLGAMLWDSARAPLARAIERNIFREAFASIFDAFVSGGSFESYLTVFRTIFGNDVSVQFTVPAAGKLEIEIIAAGVELSDFLSRYIEDNQYFFDEVIDYEDDIIAFQGVKGFKSQYEVEQMLFEMVPAGIFTTISLTIGGA